MGKIFFKWVTFIATESGMVDAMDQGRGKRGVFKGYRGLEDEKSFEDGRC